MGSECNVGGNTQITDDVRQKADIANDIHEKHKADDVRQKTHHRWCKWKTHYIWCKIEHTLQMTQDGAHITDE